MRKSGSRVVVAVLGALLFVVAGAPAGAAPPDDARSDHDRVVAFWTTERVAKAIPRDFVYDPGAGRFVPSERARGSKPPSGSGGVTGGSWNLGGLVLKTTGKVLFSMSGTYYVCSASVVDAPSLGANESAVLTAGHCAVDESDGQFAENWMFVPDYDTKPASLTTSGSFCAQTSFGCWTASALVVHTGFSQAGGFTNAALPYDFAFAVVDAGGFGLTDLDATVGDQAISFATDATTINKTYAFGYPASGKYRGKDLTYCAGQAGVDANTGGATYGLPCNMTGGSSGGPWFAPFTEGTGAGTLVSVNSYGYGGSSVMYGPRLNSEALKLYNAATSAESNTKVS